MSEWSIRYAETTAALQMMSEEELARPPAAGHFATAVTNGLLAIVAAELGGDVHLNARGWTRPAAELLKLLEDADRTNVSYTVPAMFEDEEHVITCSIDVACLGDGIKISDAIRHGREASDVLGLRHLEALEALSAHRQLGALSSASYDERLARERYVDSRLAGAAYDLLLILDEEEIERRSSREYLRQFEPVRPKHLLDFGGWGDCSVCEHETFHVERSQCVLCGYQLSAVVADDEAFMAQISASIARDES